MQSIEEVEKVKALGVEHSKIKLTGNMKFDNYSKTSDTIGSAGLRERLRIPEDAFVFIAGSTHAGEERVVFKIYQEINKKFGNFFLIIAPRHIERAQKIKRLGQRYNLIPIESTKIESLTPAQSGKHVIILDTIGELANLYSIANVAFVGGSLINNGGHNLLEPVIYGKPVFFGPYIQDFKALAHMLSKYKIGFMVKSKEMLRDGILEFYDQERQLLIEQRAREFLAQNEGATKRSINIIKSFHVINGGNRDE
jgi:3-deoxy-D-manno-octulosonic-acid transferase